MKRLQVFLTLFAILAGVMWGTAQEPPAPPPTAAPQQPSAESSTNKAKKSRAPQGFLIRGTVFTQQGLSLPGADLRIRRNGETKFHWNTFGNSRGEFAIRVPPGNEYEVVVRCKGFSDATQSVDAKNGFGEQNVVFRMEPVAEKRK